jgi:hypothetical protein
MRSRSAEELQKAKYHHHYLWHTLRSDIQVLMKIKFDYVYWMKARQ